MKWPLALALSIAAFGADRITWQKQTPSGTPGSTTWPLLSNGFWTSLYDTVNQRGIEYIAGNQNFIYSGSIWKYASGTNAFTLQNSNGSNLCPAQGGPVDTPTYPQSRHPYGGTMYDTRRNWVWQMGGVCALFVPIDTYYYDLATDVWAQVTTAHNPGDSEVTPYASTYDSVHDVLILWTSATFACPSQPCTTGVVWVFARTAENPIPGTLTAAQAATGAVADDWVDVAITIPSSTAGHYQDFYYITEETGTFFDSTSGLVYILGGCDRAGTGHGSGMFTYDPVAKSVSMLSPTGRPPVETFTANGGCRIPLAWDDSSRTLYYHQASGSGAPADWAYKPATNAFTSLSVTGTGPGSNVVAITHFDNACNCVVAFTSAISGSFDVWQGLITAPSPSAPKSGKMATSGKTRQ